VDRINQSKRAILLEPRITGVAHDGQQPRPALATVITTEKLERPQVSFLFQIFSIVFVVHQPARQVIGGGQMGQNGLFKPHGSDFVWQRSPSLVTFSSLLSKD